MFIKVTILIRAEEEGETRAVPACLAVAEISSVAEIDGKLSVKMRDGDRFVVPDMTLREFLKRKVRRHG